MSHLTDRTERSDRDERAEISEMIADSQKDAWHRNITSGQFIIATIALCFTIGGSIFGGYLGIKSEIATMRAGQDRANDRISAQEHRMEQFETQRDDQIRQNALVIERLARIETLVSERSGRRQ